MTLKKTLILFYFFSFIICSNISICGEKWCTLQKNNIHVLCIENDINNARKIIDFTDKKLTKISSDLGFTPQDTIKIIIAPSTKRFYNIAGNTLPEWSSGAAIPSQSIILLKSPRITNPDLNLEKIIVHELTHIGLYQATEGQDLMKWFNEGFAQYYSGELNMHAKILMAKRLMSNNFLKLKEIDEVFTFRKSEATLAYEEAHAAVLYLIELGGLDAVKILIDNLKQTGNMNQAMKNSINMGFDEFESKWINAMKKRYLWLVIFDYRLIISILFILLLLAAYLLKMKSTKKIKQNWEKEDIENFQTDEENTLD